jgi:hypothetical protein
MYMCTMGLCIMGVLKSYVIHIKKYQPYIKLHMYATHILNFYFKNIYTLYIMSMLHVYPKLNDFENMLPINVH